MEKIITFGAHTIEKSFGKDIVSISIPFTVMNSGSQNPSADEHQIIVSIAESRRKGWQLSNDDLLKVLFEYGKRFIIDLIERDALPSDRTIKMPMITTASHPEACPFQLSELQLPDGISVKVNSHRKNC